MSDRTYRALVGDQSVDIVFEDGQLLVDGTPTEYSFTQVREGYVSLIVNGRSLPVSVEPIGNDVLRVTIAGHRTEVRVKDERALLLEEFGLEEAGAGGGAVHAPMPGLVLNVLVAEGDTVEADEGLLVLEAMKMENELSASSAGVVTAIHVATGDAVDKNALLIEIDPDA
jgi:pyruvate carboxylase subunit B